MNIVASFGRGLGSWLGLPSRETLGLPTAMLPAGEVQLHSRPVTLITAPATPQVSSAPVASAAPSGPRAWPGYRPNLEAQANYREKIRYEARLKCEFGLHEKLEAAGMKTEARRKVLADFDRYVAGMPTPITSAAPATDATPDPITIVIRQLEGALDTLKQIAGVPDGEEVDGEAEARAAVKAGRRGEALRLLDQTITAIGVRINDRNARRDLKGKSLVAASYREQLRSIAPLATGKSDWFANLRADAGKPSPRHSPQPPAENRLKGRALVSAAFKRQGIL